MKRVYQRKKHMSLTLQAFTNSGLRSFAPPARARLFRVWPAVAATLLLWSELSRARQHLNQLDDRALTDVGLTKAQQRHECGKWFWRL
jgi:uncharacterized protein YjiS (DUF1127 family)